MDREVNEKVKKIKDTSHSRKHSHGDEPDRDDDRNSGEERGGEEDDEENTQDPEVHDDRIYDATKVQELTLGNTNAALQEHPAAPKTEALGAGDQSLATQPPPTRGGEEEKEKEKEVKESTPPTGTHHQFAPAEADPTLTQEEDEPQGTGERKGPSSATAAAGSTGYGKKIASTVYEKVAEAGTAVRAKVQRKPSGTTGTEGGGAAARQDRGVSVREYLAEKLRPGEEDKALSEAISEAFQTRRREAKEAAPEVAGSGGTGGGAGVVAKIRGAVAALVWRGGGSRASPASESTRTKGGEEEERKEAR